MEHVEGKVAFITGGASGIGLGIARVFVKNGMKVVIADSRQSALDDAMAHFRADGGNVHLIRLDVTDREAYLSAADEAEKVYGKIHVLINNAGVSSEGRMWENTFEDWDFSIGVNITGVVNGVVIMVPRILRHGEGGHVVATSSTAGLAAVKDFGIYCTTKFAVAGMMESLAADLQGTGVGASVLIPGPTATNLARSTAAIRFGEQEETGKPAAQEEAPTKEDVYAHVFMDPLETGERVLRGIRRNDIFIITHPEFKNGIIVRNEALLKAFPDEPENKERIEVIKTYGTLMYNPFYEQQTQVGLPDW